jgi:hypothetical protein
MRRREAQLNFVRNRALLPGVRVRFESLSQDGDTLAKVTARPTSERTAVLEVGGQVTASLCFVFSWLTTTYLGSMSVHHVEAKDLTNGLQIRVKYAFGMGWDVEIEGN